MSAQGKCLLPPDESGRILDRLAGLEQVVSPELARQSLLDANRVNRRKCKWMSNVSDAGVAELQTALPKLKINR